MRRCNHVLLVIDQQVGILLIVGDGTRQYWRGGDRLDGEWVQLAQRCGVGDGTSRSRVCIANEGHGWPVLSSCDRT